MSDPVDTYQKLLDAYRKLLAVYRDFLSVREDPAALTEDTFAAMLDQILDGQRGLARETLRSMCDVDWYVWDYVVPLSDVERDREMAVLAKFIRESLPSVYAQLQGEEGIKKWRELKRRKGKKHGS